MQRFESFLFTRGPLARAFDAVLAAPIPERLLAAVREPAPPRTRPDGLAPRARRAWRGSPTCFACPPSRPPSRSRRCWSAPPPAGLRTTPSARTSCRWKTAASSLRLRCSRRSSRRPAAAPPISPRGSRSSRRSPSPACSRPGAANTSSTMARHFESGGLACRRQDGVWRVLALTEPEPPRHASPGKAVPAGKRRRRPRRDQSADQGRRRPGARRGGSASSRSAGRRNREPHLGGRSRPSCNRRRTGAYHRERKRASDQVRPGAREALAPPSEDRHPTQSSSIGPRG